MADELNEEIYPPEDVAASYTDSRLQRRYPIAGLDPDERATLDEVRAKAVAQGASEDAVWIYFRSPEYTWRSECGREGWLLYEPETRAQRAFLMTVMS